MGHSNISRTSFQTKKLLKSLMLQNSTILKTDSKQRIQPRPRARVEMKNTVQQTVTQNSFSNVEVNFAPKRMAKQSVIQLPQESGPKYHLQKTKSLILASKHPHESKAQNEDI